MNAPQHEESNALADPPEESDSLAESVADPRGTIVIADDDATVRMLLYQILARENYRVIAVENGRLACEAALQEHADLVLLDWSMPVMNGLSALKELKRNFRTRNIPIVMLTVQSQIEDKVLALQAGAQDFLVKPCDARELIARIDQQFHWHAMLTTAISAIAAAREAEMSARQAQEDLRTATEIERLRETATRDPLTGLPNRLLFNDRIEQTILSSKRRSEHFATFFLDLDGFKKINDHYGHFTGDEVLRAISVRIEHVIRESDTVARIGGDEFAIVAPRILTPQNARDIAERLVANACIPIVVHDTELSISSSVGISIYPIDAVNVRELLGRADAAMYSAKRAGKNRYAFANDAVLEDGRLWETAFDE